MSVSATYSLACFELGSGSMIALGKKNLSSLKEAATLVLPCAACSLSSTPKRARRQPGQRTWVRVRVRVRVRVGFRDRDRDRDRGRDRGRVRVGTRARARVGARAGVRGAMRR